MCYDTYLDGEEDYAEAPMVDRAYHKSRILQLQREVSVLEMKLAETRKELGDTQQEVKALKNWIQDHSKTEKS